MTACFYTLITKKFNLKSEKFRELISRVNFCITIRVSCIERETTRVKLAMNEQVTVLIG